MLGNKDVMATIAVRDVPAARRFYEEVLGLTCETTDEEHGVSVYRAGAARLVVYKSEFAGTNRATAATWCLGEELEAVVEALKGRGVRFERYDLPGMERRDDVHVFGDFRAAWFKDPDGNILHVNSG